MRNEKVIGNFNILYLARIERAKGIYESIQVHRILEEKYRNIKLLIAGDGQELENVRELIKRRNIKNIEILGYVEGKNKRELFINSDIYLFPTSHGEGMPNSVLEAMAFGLPIITRRVGGLKDFFVDGKMGFSTESNNPKDLANLTEKLIVDKDLRKSIAHYSYQYAQENFLASKVVKRIENIYADLMRNE